MMGDDRRGRVSYVIGPDGSPLTLADLPPPSTKRWVIRRKAEVVAAVRGGLLSLDEACKRYTSRSRNSLPGSVRSIVMALPACARPACSNIATSLWAGFRTGSFIEFRGVPPRQLLGSARYPTIPPGRCRPAPEPCPSGRT